MLNQRRLWVSLETLEAMVHASSSPYVGHLPQPIAEAIQPQPQEALKALDALAEILRPLGRLENGLTVSCDVGENSVPLLLKKLASGTVGSVYQLTIQDHCYALKIYYDTEDAGASNLHGAWAEARAGLYFDGQPLKDMARFYSANPKAGWALFELITPEMSVETREGPTLDTFPLVFLDDHASNRIQGIRIDYGGICMPQDNIPKPKAQPATVVQLYALPEAERKAAFDLAMDTHELTLQASAVRQIHLLAKADRKSAFELAMGTDEPTIQRIGTTQICHLPILERKAAFRMAIDTHEASVQANAATQIYSLPITEQRSAFDAAMATQEPAALASAATQIFSLPQAEQKSALAAYIQVVSKRQDWLENLQVSKSE